LVATIPGATFASHGLIVRRCPEAGADSHPLGVHAVLVEILDNQLQLVEKRFA